MNALQTLAAPEGGSVLSALGWVLLIIVAAVVLLVLGLWVKKKITGDDDFEPPSMVMGSFSVGDLRRMRDNGEISDEEFERARERVISDAKERQEREAERQGNPDLPPPDAPRTKDVDLIRDAET